MGLSNHGAQWGWGRIVARTDRVRRRSPSRQRRADPVPTVSPKQDPRPDGGPASRVRLYTFEAGDLGFAMIAFTCVAALLYLLMALPSGQWLLAAAMALATFAFYAVPPCLAWLFVSWYTRFKIEISTGRLRVLDAHQTGRIHPRWVEYRRSRVDSVTVQDGWLTVSDRSGQPLIRRQTGRRTQTLRRALEHHHWC